MYILYVKIQGFHSIIKVRKSKFIILTNVRYNGHKMLKIMVVAFHCEIFNRKCQSNDQISMLNA